MKQRLVGALVLLSGGVVLWSVLFTGPAAYRVDRATQIPPPPEFTRPEQAKPVRPVNIPEIEEPAPLPEPDRVAGVEHSSAKEEPAPIRTRATKPAEEDAPSNGGSFVEPPKPAPKSAVAPKEQKSPEPVLSLETGVPNAWVIQVAAFGSADNADKLAGKLKDKGYKAYVQKRKNSAGKWLYRVFVGPELEEKRALTIKAEIEGAFSLKTMLTKYEP